MTTPDVPLRLELTFELPGTPEQLWDAIATANGISSWFLPTDLEEREGGTIVTHMGPDQSSPGTVTGWEPPRRLRYEEPGWAGLMGHEDASVTPLVTEFLVEARSGGTCVLRVVSSAFGTGAAWEQESFDGMEDGWRPYFDRLRLFLTNFPGQRVTLLEAQTTLVAAQPAVLAAMREDLGIGEVGETATFHGLAGTVERVGASDVLVHLAGALPGFFALLAYDIGDGKVMAAVQAQLFADDAAAYVAREEPIWQAWLERLAVPVG